MEKQYWIGRKRAALAMAGAAATGEARLIHFELAGRYSIKAAHCPPFMIPAAAPASEGVHATLPAPAAFPTPSHPEKRS